MADSPRKPRKIKIGIIIRIIWAMAIADLNSGKANGAWELLANQIVKTPDCFCDDTDTYTTGQQMVWNNVEAIDTAFTHSSNYEEPDLDETTIGDLTSDHATALAAL